MQGFTFVGAHVHAVSIQHSSRADRLLREACMQLVGSALCLREALNAFSSAAWHVMLPPRH